MTRIYKQRIANVQQADRGRPENGLPFSSLAAPLEGQKGRAGPNPIQESRSCRDPSVLTQSPRPWCKYARETHEEATGR